jgi:hypothetical protein
VTLSSQEAEKPVECSRYGGRLVELDGDVGANTQTLLYVELGQPKIGVELGKKRFTTGLEISTSGVGRVLLGSFPI